ncbi:uncharacterized protein LOC125587171 [Brassica napus]|uniref:uncharacterized protein LOC125587171 n=1 Tax=Brassica napus TaxID=3708 RepID=UPI00207B0BA6|nr:uncharacterized protein LOC125587171 [Brassica napus]
MGHGAGGLALLWKERVKVEVIEANANLIDTVVEYEGKSFFSSFVYADTDYIKRRELWTYLISVSDARDAPWFITGDFNDILNETEKEGGLQRPESSYNDLRTFYSEGDLYDLQYSGDPLSWRGQRGDYLVRCRLDRAAANSNWAERFPTARSVYLTYEGSDHKPIASIFEPEKKRRRGVFRFDRRLRDNPEVQELIKTTWREARNKSVTQRIALTRSAISYWSKKQQRNSRLAIDKMKEALEAAETDMANDTNLIQKINSELQEAYRKEEEYWKQRSRLLWLRLGDRNSGFFHAITRNRKRINAFSVLEDASGELVYTEDKISKAIEIVEEIQAFFATGSLPNRVNETFIRLIPKIQSPKSVADYRPIALCNVYYKIVSKLLSKRLQPLLPSIVSENQSAFVAGRAISDNVLITHEVLHYLKTSDAEKRCSMAVKTDMSKAYDRLEWNFIEHVLLRLGFHRRWVTLIMACVTSVTYAFLINGSPRGRVKPSRGIRQGDPLSPYIFILCSEVLSGLCNKAQENGRLKGIRVARGCPQVNHLLFADDTMFFVRATETSSLALKEIWQKYEAASGQSINVAKSSVTYSKLTPDALKERVADILQIHGEGGVGKYLGLPEHFGRKKKDLFNSIVSRIVQKAKSWANRKLSTAGKLTMLQSVLSPIPSYSMTCFELPASLIRRIQSALTRFWWDGPDGNKKMAWVSWDKMKQPKSLGGLGVRDFECFNDAFLAKLSWRLINNPSCLLSRVLFGKYCHEESFLTVQQASSVSHGWHGILVGRNLALKHAGWVIGDGASVGVWDDAWLSLTQQERPMGPANEDSLSLTVSDLFLPNTREWDSEAIQRWIPFEEERIKLIKPSTTGAPDKLVWLKTKSGAFTTKSGYYAALEECDDGQFANSTLSNWHRDVWRLPVAPKVKLFLWKIFQGALAVGERLVARHINVDQHCKRCNEIESTNHLLLHCRFAKKVWELAPLSTGFDLRGLVDLAELWSDLCRVVSLPPVGLQAGSLVPWILWAIWIARNNLIFNNKTSTPEETITKAVVMAREWFLAQEKVTPHKKEIPLPLRLPEGTTVVAVDAAWRGDSNTAGFGWVMKHTGSKVQFETASRSVRSPLSAEGLALRAAIMKCKELGIQQVIFESDSTQLVAALKPQSAPPELYGIVADILHCAVSFKFCSFIWIPRSKNSEADVLAKHALFSENSVLYPLGF